jgi:hypothetical protein
MLTAMDPVELGDGDPILAIKRPISVNLDPREGVAGVLDRANYRVDGLTGAICVCLRDKRRDINNIGRLTNWRSRSSTPRSDN